MDKETLGQRAFKRRKELGLTQRELAKRVSVAHVTISQWERDDTEPVGKRLFALAKGLKCEPTWLLFGDDDKAPSQASPEEKQPELTEKHKELIDLFDSLPESEQSSHLEELRARVENFNKLFEELLKARKHKSKR
ncbi:TPA: helix-turn-helix domain-containing protein [Klebsiella pneumoniae]|jgi:transcriptional regulator with XRE-family HTH domain|uniref:Helix-turn-helix domain-containing protein n=1 Tax=Klebsiella michiganensis TaxID=1134687 RepID=A0AAJ1NVQ1_9ENTR|nr:MULTISPECIES: helix-turn-helix domain-containing protein [Klebsiella]EGT3581528.1 helix-turn-helix domain-containing protein [Klebsiella oxytoca]MDG9982512.1 helix-turn-helix domain-containing protein [Klebsiella michiganensis]MDH0831744.1 helix-turn-helix domain-containing protein [Klebsiella michiganensis]MDH0844253.1 helix-turn-helix domain-containing protein [Klebsiella michiganensis]MDH0967650.1 helix-turn-helix domain-containing protein [Klebsiella michiganensis]